MKNATKHATTLRSLYRKLVRQHRPGERPQLEPLRALVLGVLREGCDETRAQRVMAQIDEEFVDINELRVATELELAGMMGHSYPEAAERAVRLRELLMSVFDAEGRLSIERMAALNKKEQRSCLRGLPMMTPFVEAHVSVLGFGQAAVPVDEMMCRYLVHGGALEPEATLDEAQRFLEAHLKADECWPFFAACRAAASRSRPRSAASSRSKAKRSTKATSRTRAKRTSRKKLASSQ